MLIKFERLNKLSINYLFAVVRGNSFTDGVEIARSCVLGGIKNIEITYTTPNAGEVISEVVKTNTDSAVLVGAGTVLDEQTARHAILAGAEFIVSPHFNQEIARVCNRYSIPYLPGCGTVTEIVTALEAGVDVVKLFPGGLLGASFIKDVHGPLPHVEMMPSGGVSLDNVGDWINSGAWAVGVGSALTKNIKTDGYDSVTKTAAQFAAAVAKFR